MRCHISKNGDMAVNKGGKRARTVEIVSSSGNDVLTRFEKGRNRRNAVGEKRPLSEAVVPIRCAAPLPRLQARSGAGSTVPRPGPGRHAPGPRVAGRRVQADAPRRRPSTSRPWRASPDRRAARAPAVVPRPLHVRTPPTRPGCRAQAQAAAPLAGGSKPPRRAATP
jgi:hypothetical protein